jgi:flagellar hook-basal body complex protein FliE
MSSIAPIPPINLGNIQNIGSSSGTKSVAGAVGAVEGATNSFEGMLKSLNDSQQNADTLLQKLSLGENVDLHQVMIGMEENDVNFRVALAVRDKLVEAYRDMMRMQI